jgi:cation transport ATPase
MTPIDAVGPRHWARSTATRPQSEASALVACTALSYVGFAGASVFAAGIIQGLAEGSLTMNALTIVIAGGALAFASWRQARRAVSSPSSRP